MRLRRLKFVIPALLIGSAIGILAFENYRKNEVPPGRQEAIVALVGQILKQGHYDPKAIDDKFSAEVFNKYMDDLDGEKKFFLKTDLDYLKKYEDRIDEEILAKEPLDFIREADSIFDLRFKEVEDVYPVVLQKPFDFTVQDSIQLDRDKLSYPQTAEDRRKVWYKMLKYRTLDKLTELQEMRSKAKEGDSLKTENDAALEADARKKIKRTYELYFDRLHSHLSDKDRFSLFMNAITQSMDPHTNYFGPVDKRYFDEQMSGTFYGIGALLKQDEDMVKIESIVTGGPAWKQGSDLKAGDIILKVAQGDEEPVDLTGFVTEDAVKLIRGAKGTEVRLTVKHIDGSVKTVPVTRGEVKLEYTFARSYIINGKHKIGYIVLPEFYFSKNGRTGPGSSAYDMAQEIKKLKAQHVDGIVLDLRFNGGGSLGDAVDIAGLFIPEGPVVQVRSRDGDVAVLKDRNPQVAYDGPLAIMVNEYSASASEILSAAMQDYKRAVIVGSPTYGKGTVQRMFELDNFISPDDREKLGDLGSIKLTIQKFYRIDGGSTQRKGVTPDVMLKDPYYDVAEKTDKDALPWDEIDKADYTVWKNPVKADALQKSSAYRVAHSEAFSMIYQNLAALKEINERKVVPMNIKAFKAEQQGNDAELKKIDKLTDIVAPLNIDNLKVDLPDINSDSIKVNRNRDLLKSYKKDPYLSETIHVMDDMIDKPSLENGKLSKN